MSEWAILRSRYGSIKQYKSRRIGVNPSDIEDFKNYLVDNGCDVSTRVFPNELFRFRICNKIGIVYDSLSGSLLAHDMAEKYINN